MIPHSRPTITRRHLEMALKQMITDNLATGEVIYEFERNFASLFGRAFSSIFVSSGTAALTLIFDNIGVGEGDEIILPSFYNSSPLQVIRAAKAKPVFVDTAEDSYNMDMDSVLELITEKTKAILVPHMFGNAAHIDELSEIKVPIIEDCGHALGSKFHGELLGSFGDYAYFSLSATRMITAGGAGGMILTKKKGVIDSLRDTRYYDKKDDFIPRYNFYPTDIQASIGLAELKNLPKSCAARREIAENYDSAVMQSKGMSRNQMHENEEPNYYRYVVSLSGSMSVKETIDFFAKYEIEASRAIYKPLHHYFSDINREAFPNTDEAFMRSLSIPIYPTLLQKDVDIITKIIKRVR